MATFSAAGPAQSTGTAPPVQALASLEALVALQAVDSPLSRRARATRRGKALLDDLDALKIALLEGQGGGPVLDRIGVLIARDGERSGDRQLDSLLDDIELRARVELAKRQR